MARLRRPGSREVSPPPEPAPVPKTVRVLAPGVSGVDPSSKRRSLVPGALWQRGAQLVEIVLIEPPTRRRHMGWVRFRELSHGSAERRVGTGQFLATSRPRPKAARAPS